MIHTNITISYLRNWLCVKHAGAATENGRSEGRGRQISNSLIRSVGLPAQKRRNLKLIVLERSGPGRRAAVRIELALRRTRRGRAGLRPPVFGMHCGGGRPRRGERNRDRAGRRRIVLVAADAEGGELLQQ